MQPMAKGDYVLINPDYADKPEHVSKVWKIAALHNVNVDIDPVTGGRGMRLHPLGLIRATPEQIAAANALPKTEILHPGTIVTVNGPRWKQPLDQLYIVVLETTKGVKLSIFGGSTRHWPSIPRDYITPVSNLALQSAIDTILRIDAASAVTS